MSVAGGNVAVTLLFIEEWQRRLVKLAILMSDDDLASSMTDEEIAALGLLLGRVHAMRHDALRLRVDELIRAVRDR